MAIFSQTFFTFVRGNLMPFAFFTAWQLLSPPLPVGWKLNFCLLMETELPLVLVNAVFELFAERLLITTF